MKDGAVTTEKEKSPESSRIVTFPERGCARISYHPRIRERTRIDARKCLFRTSERSQHRAEGELFPKGGEIYLAHAM